MRSFNEIQQMLGDLPSIKKIYLLGSTGAGKTSLVRSILGTEKYAFPTTTQIRTTVSNVEYLIEKNIKLKTTLIIKSRDDLKNSIDDVVQEAIQRGIENKRYATNDIESITLRLEESSDEKFRLKYIIPSEMINKSAIEIKENIIPKIDESKNEDGFYSIETQKLIDAIVNAFLAKAIEQFSEITGQNFDDFLLNPLYITGIKEKEEFILRNKELLKNEYPSISPLVEYTRIQGYLLADWMEVKEGFVLIDGEGIGHSLKERMDTLSSRHYDYFRFCNSIVLVEKGDDPFVSGGKGAIESIILNGYKDKLRLVFSKTDRIEESNTNAYLKKRIDNLKTAIEDNDIELQSNDLKFYKIGSLNQNTIPDKSKSEVNKLLKDILSQVQLSHKTLEYDFSSFLYNLNTEWFVDDFSKRMDKEHWTVIRALSRRLYNFETEYKNIKPLSLVLMFIMKDINLFLRGVDDLDSSVIAAQNFIKQKSSQNLILFIFNGLISSKKHLWQQAYEEKGEGSHSRRKKFIIENIIKSFIPNKDSEEFKKFRISVKEILLVSGTKELAFPKRITLKKAEINKIYGEKSFSWSLSHDINILIGKNGSGKSTILKIIDACISSKQSVIDRYDNPYVKLFLSKEYFDGGNADIEITNQSPQPNIKSVLINTFDDERVLHDTLSGLLSKFSEYERQLRIIFDERAESIKRNINAIVSNIVAASSEDLIRFRELQIEQNSIESSVFEKFNNFKKIVNQFLAYSEKEIITNDKENTLLVLVKSKNKDKKIKVDFLSSGEKQLLIIFLSIVVYADDAFILLLDEPEISLHVEWQYMLIDKIKELNPNIQVIIATHNPIMTLNRSFGEVGIIKLENDVLNVEKVETKMMDVSTILIKYFGLSSVLGKDTQDKIRTFNELKFREERLDEPDKKQLNDIGEVLNNGLISGLVNDRKYLKFMEFVRDHKHLNFHEYEYLSDAEVNELLKDFEDFLK
ncbi:MAG: hypothetical protein BWK73_33905 [Thiothrix lacustris]|uniref:ATPase AAA-type core domain-containing protein n=1 Tax=Thiothrix lacustris TaxID=525917 RepID=A0A1Y1QH62_9GAMM|nr:MAG: hypothetical protein BWK73_33905 [Thiothrix lacustris]